MMMDQGRGGAPPYLLPGVHYPVLREGYIGVQRQPGPPLVFCLARVRVWAVRCYLGDRPQADLKPSLQALSYICQAAG